jgi:hypothetical protein
MYEKGKMRPVKTIYLLRKCRICNKDRTYIFHCYLFQIGSQSAGQTDFQGGSSEGKYG